MEDRGTASQRAPRWLRRVAWFVAIWASSVGALALISYGLRLWIGPA